MNHPYSCWRGSSATAADALDPADVRGSQRLSELTLSDLTLSELALPELALPELISRFRAEDVQEHALRIAAAKWGEVGDVNTLDGMKLPLLRLQK